MIKIIVNLWNCKKVKCSTKFPMLQREAGAGEVIRKHPIIVAIKNMYVYKNMYRYVPSWLVYCITYKVFLLESSVL